MLVSFHGPQQGHIFLYCLYQSESWQETAYFGKHEESLFNGLIPKL